MLVMFFYLHFKKQFISACNTALKCEHEKHFFCSLIYFFSKLNKLKKLNVSKQAHHLRKKKAHRSIQNSYLTIQFLNFRKGIILF